MEATIIFFIWLAVAVLGIVASIRKKARAAQGGAPASKPYISMDDILDTLQQTGYRDHVKTERETVREDETTAKATPEPFVEGERVTAAAPAEPVTDEPAPVQEAKESPELELDPVKMVIYSEIMEPGYEKY